jgi:hypothetical protein
MADINNRLALKSVSRAFAQLADHPIRLISHCPTNASGATTAAQTSSAIESYRANLKNIYSSEISGQIPAKTVPHRNPRNVDFVKRKRTVMSREIMDTTRGLRWNLLL